MEFDLSTQNASEMQKKFFSLSLFVVLMGIMQFTISSSPPEKEKAQREFNDNYKIFALNIPEDANFAGEELPVHDFEVRERFDKELLVNTYWQSSTLLNVKKAHRYFPTIERILKREGVPDDFKFLALAESGLSNVVSPAGAAGYWQFLENTGRSYGLIINDEIDERYHLEKSTVAACRYLKDSYRSFKNWTLVAASYNMGVSSLKIHMERQDVESYYDLFLNTETSRYLFRLIALKEIYKNPTLYGFYYNPSQLYHEIPTTKVKIDSAVPSWTDFAKDNGISYKTLKTLNPWLKKPSLINKERKVYYVEIPKEKPSVKWKQKIVPSDSVSVPEPEGNGFELNTKELIHTVVNGDDLGDIALKYKVSVKQIKEWNNLEDDKIRIGQKLTVYQK